MVEATHCTAAKDGQTDGRSVWVGSSDIAAGRRHNHRIMIAASSPRKQTRHSARTATSRAHPPVPGSRRFVYDTIRYISVCFRHCPHSMRSRVYVTVRRCLSVCLSHSPAAAASVPLWARRTGDIDRLLPGAQQQTRAVRRCRLAWETEHRLATPLLHRALNWVSVKRRTIRYDTRYYFNVRSKADTNQLNLPHGNDN